MEKNKNFDILHKVYNILQCIINLTMLFSEILVGITIAFQTPVSYDLQPNSNTLPRVFLIYFSDYILFIF